MAWTELLRSTGTDEEMVREMDKDISRLSMIASRFSKIGSRPNMEREDLNDVVARATGYMQTRISSRISLTTSLSPQPLPVDMSAPLFEWVMENLIKNAVDAMEGSGSIDVATSAEGNRACVTVTDTGKGIPRKNHKTVFNPGFTTKKRGWGLGLALANASSSNTTGDASSWPGQSRRAAPHSASSCRSSDLEHAAGRHS